MKKNTTVEVNGIQQNFDSIKDCKEYIKLEGIKNGVIYIEHPLNQYTKSSVKDFMSKS